MATLSAGANFNVATGGQQQDTSNLTAFSGLLDAGLNIAGSVLDGRREAASQAPDNSYLTRELGRQMGRADALRAEGRMQEAANLEARVVTEFIARGGDATDDNTKLLIEQMTGRPFEYVGLTPDEININEMIQTDEFRVAYTTMRANNPDLSEREVQQMAVNQMAANETAQQVIQNASNTWATGQQAAYQQQIANFNEQMRAGLNVANRRSGQVALEDVQNMRVQFNQFRTNVFTSRPANVTDAEWGPIEDQLNAMEENLTYMEELAGTSNIDAKLSLQILDAVQANGNGTIGDSMLGRILMGDTNAIINMGGNLGEMIDLSRTVFATPLTGVDVRDTNSGFVEPGESNGVSADPNEAYENATAQLSLSNSLTATLGNSEESRTRFGQNTMTALSNLKAVHDAGEYLPSDQYASMFSDAYFNNLNQIKDSDPALYESLKSHTNEVLTQVAFGLNQRLNSLGNDWGYEFNPATGAYRVSRDSIEALVKRKAGVSEVPQEFLDALEAEYGGDYEAALNDRGFRLTRTGANAYGPLIRGIASRSFSELSPEVKELVAAQQQVVDTQARLGGLQPGPTEVSPVQQPEVLLETPPDFATKFEEFSMFESGATLIETAAQTMGWNEDTQRGMLASYLSAGGVDIDPAKTAWCAAFVNATLERTGINGTRALNARSFLEWGQEVTDPQVGDIVVLSRGNNPAQGHVGFFQGYDDNGDILILGGNQSDSVNVQSYDANRLLGFRRPDGVAQAEAEAPDYLPNILQRAATEENFFPVDVAPEVGDTTPAPAPESTPAPTSQSTSEEEPASRMRLNPTKRAAERAASEVSTEDADAIVAARLRELEMAEVGSQEELEQLKQEGVIQAGEIVLVDGKVTRA